MGGLGRHLAWLAPLAGVLLCQACETSPLRRYAGAPSGASAEVALTPGMKLAAPGIGNDATSTSDWLFSNAAGVSTNFSQGAYPTMPMPSPGAVTAGAGNRDNLRVDVTAGAGFGPFDPLDWSNNPTLNAFTGRLSVDDYWRGFDDARQFEAVVDFAASGQGIGVDLDIGFSPRARYRRDGELQVRSFGYEFRVGQNLLAPDFDQRGTSAASQSWYIFAGSNGDAVIWDAGSTGFDLNPIDDLRLRDQVSVGDMQAGFAFNRFGGQFSLSYIRREVRYEDNSQIVRQGEDFGGVSFTIRR